MGCANSKAAGVVELLTPALSRKPLPPGFPALGVAIEALEELAALCEPRWTTNEACMLKVRPLTAPPGVADVATCTNPEQQWYTHEYVSDDAAVAPIAADGAANIPAQHTVLRQASRSYCELLIELGKGHQVGRATIFVSHAWKVRCAVLCCPGCCVPADRAGAAMQYTFVDVVTALRAHVNKLKAAPGCDGREIFVWFDIASVNQVRC